MSHLEPSATQGILHHIPPLTAFEPITSTTRPPNLILWIGGLTDTYHSVSYPYTLSSNLPSRWNLAQVNLSSAAQGWGTSSLSQDVAELAKIVSYFRGQRQGKIVLMGHSTGCQDCLHYLTSVRGKGEGKERPRVDGIILQAPVSDREALVNEVGQKDYDRLNELAGQMVKEGKQEDILPRSVTKSVVGDAPVTARRWLSLASPDGKGEDDYFSSDLPEERLLGTFGQVKVPLLILYGENDEFVPEKVDKKGLVRKWIKIVRDNGGEVDGRSEELLYGASHNLNGDPEEVVQELIKRVVGFVTSR